MRGKVCTITEIVLKVLCTTGLIFLGMNFFYGEFALFISIFFIAG
jgi:hypothetical protein